MKRGMDATFFAMPIVILALLVGCSTGSDNPAPAPSPSSSVTATVGTAGGTVTGPDGVQVVIPPGALGGNTVIGIARNTAGAPAGLPDGVGAAGAVYEFTPHGTIFNKPVLIRFPIPSGATNLYALMNSAVQENKWTADGYRVNGNFIEFERHTFSWGGGTYACAGTAPLVCLPQASGGVAISATPPSALTQISPSQPWNAGVFALNGPATLHVTMTYRDANTCSGASASLKHWPFASQQSPFPFTVGAPLGVIPPPPMTMYATVGTGGGGCFDSGRHGHVQCRFDESGTGTKSPEGLIPMYGR